MTDPSNATGSTPPRVALDLDGTLYDFDGHVRTLYRQMHWHQPRAATLPTQARHYLDTRDDTHFASMGDLLQWYTQMQGWYNEPAYPNTLTAVYALQQLPIELHLVTSRPAHASLQTRCAMTRDHGPDQVVVITQQPKWELGYNLYIDDAPEQIEHYIEHGTDYLIYDQPWNQGLPGRRVYDPLGIYTAVRYWALPSAEPSWTDLMRSSTL